MSPGLVWCGLFEFGLVWFAVVDFALVFWSIMFRKVDSSLVSFEFVLTEHRWDKLGLGFVKFELR